MYINIKIHTPPKDIQEFSKVTSKFKKINNIDFEINIVLNYSLKDEDDVPIKGEYPVDEVNNIYINPTECLSSNEDIFGFTYQEDLMSVCIHEFCHYLTYQHYLTIISDFKQQFSTDRLYLNSYSNTGEYEEELVESMVMYILNPYLLKLISCKHWKFFKTYFKSPTASTCKKLYEYYKNWKSEVKEELKNKWKIIYNIETDKFIKIGV